MSGPLSGLRVIEFVGLGPCPFAAMMLADMGADVIRIERPAKNGATNPYPILGTRFDVMARNRRSLALDLKQPQAVGLLLDLVARAEVLMEGFRPGVMERLGLGPDICMERNPRLVYTRVTGWGQHGPLNRAAGHDLNYLALSGLLPSMGRPGTTPPPPLNLIGDFGAGGMMSAFGIACGVMHARATGQGQVVDSAMLDGCNLLGAMIYGFHAMGHWSSERGRNWIDGGAPYYDTYACADDMLIAIGPIEPEFYRILCHLCGADDPIFEQINEVARWPEIKSKMIDLFLQKTREEWCELLEGTDACFAPVMSLNDAPNHPQNIARNNFIEISGVTQPAPAPRFQHTPGKVNLPPPQPGEHNMEILIEWGIDRVRVDNLIAAGVI